MATVQRKCWLTFEGGAQKKPRLWEMSRAYPDVSFDIRQASVREDIGIMAVLFEGEEADVDAALQHLQDNDVVVESATGVSKAI